MKMKTKNIFSLTHLFLLSFIAVITVAFMACSGSGNDNNKAAPESMVNTGPTDEDIAASYTAFGEVDSALYESGKATFKTKCVSCHQLDAKVVGPILRDVTKRRTAQWINSMLTDPAAWVQSDPIAQQVFEENNKVQMLVPGGTTADERRALIEYLRKEGNQ